MILGNIDRLPEKLMEAKGLIKSLLEDLKEINRHTDKMIFIEYQDWHDEYSPERTDPCPDYYGTYALMNGLGEKIGVNMDTDELDTVICSLVEFMEHLYEKKESY